MSNEMTRIAYESDKVIDSDSIKLVIETTVYVSPTALANVEQKVGKDGKPYENAFAQANIKQVLIKTDHAELHRLVIGFLNGKPPSVLIPKELVMDAKQLGRTMLKIAEPPKQTAVVGSLPAANPFTGLPPVTGKAQDMRLQVIAGYKAPQAIEKAKQAYKDWIAANWSTDALDAIHGALMQTWKANASVEHLELAEFAKQAGASELSEQVYKGFLLSLE